MFDRYRNHQSPALDLDKNSKSKNKNLTFSNYEKVEHIRQKIKIFKRDIITRSYAHFFNAKTINSVSIISIER